MEIWNEILSIVISNGIFAILFVWLFYYMLRDSAKRETKYQQTISQLTKHLEVLDDVERDLKDIKELLKAEEEDEKVL